jgi:hypothetical protein
MSDTIALMWDCNGLEAVVNVTDIDRQRTWAMLQGRKKNQVPAPPNLLMWQMRAQANPQRHYEIYLISAENDMTVDDICEAFHKAPQEMADTVRRIGHRYYSDRAPVKVSIR